MTQREYNQAVGRRKETTAIVKLYAKGKGDFALKTATGKDYSLKEYFGGNEYLYQNAIAPFLTIGAETLKKFDADIVVKGGGVGGQSDAIKLAFARALVEWNSDLRPTLKPHGLLKRDPRIKERKKPGLKKARKAPTWSKR